MQEGQPLGDLVTAIGHMTGQMYKAAEAGDWEGVCKLERERAPLYIQWMQRQVPLPESLRAAVETLLAQETEIRQMAATRQESIKAELTHLDNRRKLKNAYGG